ncbi:MAG: dephospho-CoA kinase [Geminicoccaceae bacterium]|nr:dephospho-CoA kinase [Geminicoccaceae bacterium]
MIVVGLTGSMAMGKSRVARRFAQYGVPVLDSDAVVHRLFLAGSPLPPRVDALFPGTLDRDGGVDRRTLGACVFGDALALRRLEGLVHPFVRAAQHRFLAGAARRGAGIAVLDVPLLLETGGGRRCDLVVVVDAHPAIQADRALRRPGMTLARLEAVRAQQMPGPKKRRLADVVVASGRDRGAVSEAVAGVVLRAAAMRPRAWPEAWLQGSNGS